MLSPYQAQMIAWERMKDAIREAEQDRLVRLAKSPRQVRKWRLPTRQTLGSLSTLFARRQTSPAFDVAARSDAPSCC